LFDLRLLGPPVLLVNGKPVPLLRKPLALLAFLTMEQARPYERTTLSEMFWPDFPKSRADNSLRQALRSLRKVLDIPSGPPLFPESRTSVTINPDHPLRIDSQKLNRPPASCPFFHDPEHCPSCETRILEALREIRGPFLEGFSLPDCEEFENWVTGTREDLLVRVGWQTDRLVRLREKTGNFEEAILLTERTLRMDPLDEPRHGRMMLLLAGSGNRTAALHQFEVCRKILREQLGVEPDPKTRAILERIRSGDTTSSVSPPVSDSRIPSDFPLSPSYRPATALYLELHPGEEEDPERGASVVRERLDRIAATAKSLGGLIGRTQGNSVLVWFGVRDQPEGAARRAARAALEIRTLMLEVPAGKSREIALHGGIHSGRILRGAPTDPPDPTGAVSRTAMALCMQAEQGSILVSESSARLLKEQFRLSEADDFRILGTRKKGFFLLDFSEKNAQWTEHRPLFGRDRELRFFSELFGRDRGGVLVVEGEAGIGKSALVRACLDHAALHGGAIRTIECFPQYADSPFFPLVRMLRGQAGVTEGLEQEEAHVRLRSYVRSLSLPEEKTAVALLGSLFSLPPHPEFPLPPLPASALREELSKVIRSILGVRAGEGAFLLLVEDLHWIDLSTGELLRGILSDSFFTEKIFFLLTTRTGEAPPWLSRVLDLRKIRLSPLMEEDSRSMIRAMSSDAPLSDAEISRIVRTADGIPLFIEELARERIEERRGAPRGRTPAVPATLSEVLASRLERHAGARPLLQRAALFGRTVPMDLLRALSPEPPELFDALLRQVVLSGLVRTEPDPSGEIFAFRHALIAEAARSSLPSAAQKLLHRKIAETIRDRFPDRAAANPEIVARHFEGAEEWGEAVDWFEKAARQTYVNGALSESEHQILKALEILPFCTTSPGDLDGKSRLLILKGSIQVDLYGYGNPLAAGAFREALSLPDEGSLLSEEAFYALHGFFETLYGGTDLRELRRVSDSLLGMARERENADFSIVSLWAGGSTYFWEGRFVSSLDAFERCLEIGETVGKRGDCWAENRNGVIVQATSYRLWSLWFLGRYRSAGRNLDLALVWAQDQKNMKKIGHLLTFAIILMRFFRLPARVIDACDILEDSIRLMKTEGWTPTCHGFRGWAEVMKGNPGGLPMILRSVALSRKYHRLAEVTYLSLLSEAYLVLGEPRKSRGVADSALRFSEKSGTHFFDAELWRIKGEVALLEGKRKLSREYFGKALEISRSQGARALELRAVISLGRLLWEDGKRKKALELMSGVVDLLDGPESDPSLPDIREALDIRRQLS
jgi:DNA-binding SARP family transcriptional activator/tetratricopeptide (TPR) repeat protein